MSASSNSTVAKTAFETEPSSSQPSRCLSRLSEANFCMGSCSQWPRRMPFHLAENQPFLDGNKRTALEACLVFLDLNGVVVTDPEGRLFDAMLAMPNRSMTKDGIASVLRSLPQEIV